MSRPTRSSRQRVSTLGRRRRLQLESLERRQLLAGDLLFADSFEVASEWSSKWVQDSQNDWFRSTQRKTDGSRSAEVDGFANNATLTLKNAIDLSDYSSAELTFSWYIESSWDTGEYIAIDVFNGSWQEVDRLRGNVDAENAWHHETIVLDDYMSAGFLMRFRASVSASAEDGNVDNVRVLGVLANMEPVGLISHWRADNDASDSVGNNHGTLVSGTAFANGQIGQAFSFDGVNDRVLVPDSPSLRLTKSMTIEGWIRVDSLPAPGQPGEIFFRGDDRGGLDPYSLSIQPDGRLRYEVASLTDAASVWAPMPIGEFVHVAATLDDTSGSMRLYLNGRLVSETTTTVRPFGNLDPGRNPGIGIGNHGGYPHTPHNFPFHGRIDDLKIYDVPLSSLHILENFFVGNGSIQPSFSIDDASVVEGDLGFGFTGAFVNAGDSGLSLPSGMTFGPDGNLYVSSFATNSVLRYDGTTGVLKDIFVTSGSGGLGSPQDLAFYNGNLFVASVSTNSILRFNGTTGAPIAGFMQPELGGLESPRGLLFGTNNDLYVTSTGSYDAVLRYNATTGAFVDEFIAAGNGLDNPTRVVLGPDGNFYVSSTSAASNSVLRYAPNGDFIDSFVSPGEGGLNGPTSIVFDSGLMYVANARGDSVLTYDQNNGDFVGVAVLSGSGNLDNASAMLFDSAGRLYVGSRSTGEVLRYEDTSAAQLTVSLSWPSPEIVTVEFETSNGSAIAGSDFEATAGMLTFAPGVTSRSIFIPILEDTVAEPDETFALTVSNGVNASIEDATGIVTISERRFSIDDVAVFENDATPHYRGPFVESPLRENFVSMGFGPDGSIYASSQSTGGAIDRYNGSSGEFVERLVESGLVQGVRSPIFRNGILYVGSEYTNEVLRFDGTTGEFVGVFVTAGAGGIDGPHGMTFGPDVNADGVPELYVAGRNSANVVRYDGVTGQPLGTFISPGAGGLSYPEGLSFDPLHSSLFVASSGSGAVIKYDALTGAYQGIGASVPAGPKDVKFGADGRMYVASSGDDRIIRFTPSGDFVDDFVPSGLPGFDNPGRLDFGPDGNLYVSGSGIKEIARFGTETEAVFTVQLSAPSSQTVSVDFAIANGPAIAGSDYSAVSGTLVFEPGVTARKILVPILNDALYEGDETFVVILSNASAFGFAVSQGIGTILDDDPSQPPTANSDSYNTAEDTQLLVPANGVLANDSDPENALLTAVVVTTTSHGALTLNSDGSFSYSPHDNFFGSDSFTYRANDGTSDSNLATVTISVTPVNDAPVAAADSYTVDQDAVLSIAAQGVLSNDSDGDGDTLTAIAWSGNSAQGGQVVLNSNGSFTYTPPTGFAGTDTFSYRASDGSLTSNWATVSIAVEADNVNAMYVYDIRFESRYWGLQRRAVFEIRWDSNGDGQGGSADARRAGVSITVEFAGQTYSGTTDVNGLFRTSWIGNPGSGTYAQVVDMALADYVWNPLALDLEDDTDGDGRPDAQL